MVYIVGDLHLREEKPFYYVVKYVLDELLSLINEGDTIIFTGDFFHRSHPYIEELSLANKFFDGCKAHKASIVILAGNHEYFHKRDTFVEYAFTDEDFTFIEKPTLLTFENNPYLFLPWISNERLNKMKCQSLKEYYTSYFKDQLDLSRINKNKKLRVIYHFEDTSCWWCKDSAVDFTELNAIYSNIEYIGGHIHVRQDNYLGVPEITRKDEAGQTGQIITVDGDTEDKLYLKKLLDYKTLSYEELLKDDLDKHLCWILEVTDSPSLDEVSEFINKHENLYLDDFNLRFDETREIFEDDLDNEEHSIKEFFDLYVEENAVSKPIADYINSDILK